MTSPRLGDELLIEVDADRPGTPGGEFGQRRPRAATGVHHRLPRFDCQQVV